MRKFIFIWFLAVGIISTYGAVWAARTLRMTELNSYEGNIVRYTAEQAAHAVETGGVASLESVEKQLDPKRKLRFFVFDSAFHEVSSVQTPVQMQDLVRRLRPEDHVRFALVAGGLMAATAVQGAQGRIYRVVVWFPSRRIASIPIYWWRWTSRIAVVAAVAGLLCWWLALSLSSPLTRLRQAARRFASGDLKARAGASTFPSRLPEYKELARDFDEMAGRIENLVDSQRNLLRDVSHELRTPLTRLSLAINNARLSPAPSIGDSLIRIEQEGQRLDSLIGRILCLSRLEGLADAPRRETIECADFIESIVSDADFEATARNRKVSIARAEMCRITGDRELLREAIENILRNGIRYTPEGTAVTVDAWRASPERYRIAIRDCGPGVPGEHLSRIFDVFFRAPAQAGMHSSGFGIGLAIAKRAIGIHHGTIDAQNLADGGLEVVIGLPVEGASV